MKGFVSDICNGIVSEPKHTLHDKNSQEYRKISRASPNYVYHREDTSACNEYISLKQPLCIVRGKFAQDK